MIVAMSSLSLFGSIYSDIDSLTHTLALLAAYARYGEELFVYIGMLVVVYKWRRIDSQESVRITLFFCF